MGIDLVEDGPDMSSFAHLGQEDAWDEGPWSGNQAHDISAFRKVARRGLTEAGLSYPWLMLRDAAYVSLRVSETGWLGVMSR